MRFGNERAKPAPRAGKITFYAMVLRDQRGGDGATESAEPIERWETKRGVVLHVFGSFYSEVDTLISWRSYEYSHRW